MVGVWQGMGEALSEGWDDLSQLGGAIGRGAQRLGTKAIGPVVREVGGDIGSGEQKIAGGVFRNYGSPAYKMGSAVQGAGVGGAVGGSVAGAVVGGVRGWNDAGSSTAKIRNGRQGQNGFYTRTAQQQIDEWSKSGGYQMKNGVRQDYAPKGTVDEYTQTHFDKTGMSQQQIWNTTIGRGWVLGGRKIAAEDRGVKWAGSAEQSAAQQRLPGDKNFKASRDIDRGPVGGRLQKGDVKSAPRIQPGQAKPAKYPSNFMGPIPNNASRAAPKSGSGKSVAAADPFMGKSQPKKAAPSVKTKKGTGGGGGSW